ncbi:MAG: response regulator [Rhodospirillales bacterium CG15_BIG_FIL_POST_REV_8_21_14_020_66_15]|nr:MAG: response regulator [Rhodospirillales bacterium CG15_BIG_FIL_POST_REV_8_21_14_020_66_15]
MKAILVVDDDEDSRDYISTILIRAGYEVTTAIDGDAGMDVVHARASRPFDLIISDIFMPGRDGIEFLGGLRQYYPDLPVIAVTGGYTGVKRPYADSMTAMGAAQSLLKPFTPAELLAAVTAVLEA